MEQLDFLQGSPEWHQHRRTHFNASDAPAMLGISQYKTRTQLLDELKTGIAPEVDEATQLRFDNGHHFEALARQLAEKIIGRALYPVIGSEGKLSASFDGLTSDDKINFEHKSLNDELRAAFDLIDATGIVALSDMYLAQIEQQGMVSDCERTLFMASKWDENDELIEERHCWVERNHDMRDRLLQGWTQFAIDLENYQHVEILEKPKAEVTIELPALFIQAQGEIIDSNMIAYGEALTKKLAEVRAIKLVTDQDFSNAKEAAKLFREQCKKLELTKEAMLSQTVTIGEAARMMDAWHEDLRVTALQLEKDVEKEDLAKKRAMVSDGQQAYLAHCTQLADLLKGSGVIFIADSVDFPSAIKGKRNYASMQDAIDTALANGKITADAKAKDLRDKIKWFKENGGSQHQFLFADLQSILIKPADDFQLAVTSRIEAHKKAEAEKLEAETARIRAEEESKARAKVEAEQRAAAADAIEARRKAVALAEQKASLAASQREHDKSLMGKPAVLQPETPSLSVVELPSKYVRPSEEELLTCWAANFNVPYLTASAWLFELAETMKEAA
jgi:putative phage-type endonuclease